MNLLIPSTSLQQALITYSYFLGRATDSRIDVWRPTGTKMSYVNVLYRLGDFCTVVEPVLCSAQRLNINPCFKVAR